MIHEVYSDSVSNVFTVRCYTESGIAIAVRLLCLSVHWSSVTEVFWLRRFEYFENLMPH